MAFYYSDDPVRDAENYHAAQDRELDRRPVCEECGDPVQEDHYWEINDEVVCTSCLISNHKKSVEDYIE